MSIRPLCMGTAVAGLSAGAAGHAAADSLRGLPRDSTDACATARGLPAAAECVNFLDRPQATRRDHTGQVPAADISSVRIGWCFDGEPNANFHRSGQSSPHDLFAFLAAGFAGT